MGHLSLHQQQTAPDPSVLIIGPDCPPGRQPGVYGTRPDLRKQSETGGFSSLGLTRQWYVRCSPVSRNLLSVATKSCHGKPAAGDCKRCYHGPSPHAPTD